MSNVTQLYLRNIIFGVSDSLVSTVGLLAGIDASGTTRQTILLTGIVYAFVEAFSMAVGSFLSEQSAEQYAAGGEYTVDSMALTAGTAMFISFVVASFIPIFPYFFFSITTALWVSIALSVAALFVLGLATAKITKVRLFSHALKMALLGGGAIVIGAVVGKLVKVG